MEVYKEIKGYEGLYEVSNFGNVRSLKFNKERILKPSLSNGYKQVTLRKEGISNKMYIHRLVYMVFSGDLISKMTIDHIDNNPLNNNVENLQQITNRLNSSKDQKNRTSKYTGVCWHKRNKSWYVSIRINGKSKHLGSFDSELEASDIYKEALNYIQQ